MARPRVVLGLGISVWSDRALERGGGGHRENRHYSRARWGSPRPASEVTAANWLRCPRPRTNGREGARPPTALPLLQVAATDRPCRRPLPNARRQLFDNSPPPAQLAQLRRLAAPDRWPPAVWVCSTPSTSRGQPLAPASTRTGARARLPARHAPAAGPPGTAYSTNAPDRQPAAALPAASRAGNPSRCRRAVVRLPPPPRPQRTRPRRASPQP